MVFFFFFFFFFFLLGIVFICSDTKVHEKIVDIPMGADGVPPVAHLFQFAKYFDVPFLAKVVSSAESYKAFPCNSSSLFV